MQQLQEAPVGGDLEARIARLEGIFRLGGLGAPQGDPALLDAIQRQTGFMAKILGDKALASAQTGPMRIGTTNVEDGSITADKIAVGAITAGLIDVDTLSAITADMGTLTGGKIRIPGAGNAHIEIDGSLVTPEIKLYDSAGVQRASLKADGSGWLGASASFSWTSAGVLSIDGARINNATITTGKISDVGFDKLTDGTITGVGTMGSGGAIKTASSGARVEIDSGGIRGFSGGSTKQFEVAAASGKAKFGDGQDAHIDATGIHLQDADVIEWATNGFSMAVSGSLFLFTGPDGETIAMGASSISLGKSTGGVAIVGTLWLGNRSDAGNGAMWYDLASNTFKVREGGATKTITTV